MCASVGGWVDGRGVCVRAWVRVGLCIRGWVLVLLLLVLVLVLQLLLLLLVVACCLKSWAS